MHAQVERLGGGTYGVVYKAVEEAEDGTPVGETFAVKYYVDETRTVTRDGLGCTTIRELSTVSVSRNDNPPKIKGFCTL